MVCTSQPLEEAIEDRGTQWVTVDRPFSDILVNSLQRVALADAQIKDAIASIQLHEESHTVDIGVQEMRRGHLAIFLKGYHSPHMVLCDRYKRAAIAVTDSF